MRGQPALERHLDLFATGTDGAVWSTWWEQGPGWQRWFLIHPEVKMQPGATVSALWRSNDTHLDLRHPPGRPGLHQPDHRLPGRPAFTPDGGNPDRYCRDPNTVQAGRPGYNWPEVCTYAPNCYLPIACYQLCQTYGPNIHAGFVYWQPSASYGFLYGMAEKDYFRQFRFDLASRNVDENATRVSSYRAPEELPGAVAISANGDRNGIV